MANMSTRVMRAWNVLGQTVRRPNADPVIALRDWMAGELQQVSRKVPPLLEAALAEQPWRVLWSTAPEVLPTSERAVAEFQAALQTTPPTYDPVGVFEWAKASLWSLAVFTLPNDCCDNDQFDLEVWVEPSSASAVLGCQLGEWYVFRDRFPSDWAPLDPWTGDPDALRPATRVEVQRLLPSADWP